MSKREAERLAPGLYRLHWKGGGSSLASVGILNDGTRWFAPTNWTNAKPEGIASTKWAMVARVGLIEAAGAVH